MTLFGGYSRSMSDPHRERVAASFSGGFGRQGLLGGAPPCLSCRDEEGGPAIRRSNRRRARPEGRGRAARCVEVLNLL